MNTITYSKLTKENFNLGSLDRFIRHHEVKECWRKIDGELVLVKNEFTENWGAEELREKARSVQNGIADGGFAYGAFDENEVIGFIYLTKRFFGSENQYIELKEFHVSEPYRRKGVGKELFKLACSEAREVGAKKLYISAHSSKESQAAYRCLGCVEAVEVDKKIAENEPFDIQMEYVL